MCKGLKNQEQAGERVRESQVLGRKNPLGLSRDFSGRSLSQPLPRPRAPGAPGCLWGAEASGIPAPRGLRRAPSDLQRRRLVFIL